MSHRTAMQVIKRRLVGTEGSARVKVLRAALDDLPGYRNGPYADLRKWLLAELDQTRQRARVEHRDSIAVKRQGVAQVAVVGPPNAGKSSLLQALSSVQIKTGDYAFTTTRPIPAVIRAGGVLVQLVEIPGLIEGANEDRGGGKALLSVLRTADAMVLCHDLTAPVSLLEGLRFELDAAGIDLPAIVAATKGDEAPAGALEAVRCAAPGLDVVAVSILDDALLDAFREHVWQLTGLVRISLRRDGEPAHDTLALEPPVTVIDVARSIHNELADRCKAALVWGPSAHFPGERVGPGRVLDDGDEVEILT
ncbi:MAG TPA: GTPase [Acidimicrobiales bacterium]|nr:GTPase [Acidimicrobiales bacterium]